MSVLKKQQMPKMSKAIYTCSNKDSRIIEIIKCEEQELFQFHICKSIPSKYTEMFLETISTY